MSLYITGTKLGNQYKKINMQFSYFKMAWRNFRRNKTLSAINIFGLGTGIATAIMIMLFVADELSFDQYNINANRIARIVLKAKMNGEIIQESITPAPVGPTLATELTDVEQATRLRDWGVPSITYGDKTFREGRMVFADPNFFQVFTLIFLRGNPATVLNEPNAVVITRKQAQKFFGNEDPIGKIIVLKESNDPLHVTGVISEVPANSHFHFEFFVSMTGLQSAKDNNWMASNFFTYVLLGKKATAKGLEAQLPAIVNKYMAPQIVQLGMSYEKFKQNGNEIAFYVQPLTDIHLQTDFNPQNEMEPAGDLKSVYIFAAVAVFMLAIACVNFMNLSTASATKRTKEIGVKKILGSPRLQLIRQFLTESFVAVIASILFAAVLIEIALPMFNQLSGKHLPAGLLFTPKVLIAVAGLTVIVTLLAGAYPAIFLSSFKPIAALKNKSAAHGDKSLRSGLVVFQFVVSSALILAIIVVDRQMDYIQSKNIGYERQHMIVMRDVNKLGNRENAFVNELMSDARITDITHSAFVPAGPSDNYMTTVYPGGQKDAVRRTLLYNVDAHYLPTMGMALASGRNFVETTGTDSLNVILNETSVKAFNLGPNPIGQPLSIKTSDETVKIFTIIGVVKDFHLQSLHQPIVPLIMLNHPYGGLIARIKTEDVQSLIASIEKKWKKYDVGEELTVATLDNLYNETYVAEQKMGTLLRIFGVLTVIIACLGLFGLVTFTAELRVKEIGIRKVLGAGVAQVVTLLSRDLIILVALSFLVAFPVGYYFMHQWLQDFAYKIEITWWMPALSAVMTLSISVALMSFKTIRAALTNPVDSLRSE